MAMICRNGVSECDGYSNCYEDEKSLVECPNCGTQLYTGETVYRLSDGEIIGCEYCIKEKNAGALIE